MPENDNTPLKAIVKDDKDDKNNRDSNDKGVELNQIFDEIFAADSLELFYKCIRSKIGDEGSGNKVYTCMHKNIVFIVKLCYWEKSYAELYNLDKKNKLHKTDLEIKVGEVIRDEIIKKNLSSSFVEMIYYKTIDGAITKLAPSKDKCPSLLFNRGLGTLGNIQAGLCDQLSHIKKNMSYDKMSFIVMETCGESFFDFIAGGKMYESKYIVFKSLLFQVIHALYVMRKLYPNSYHGDLHIWNILIKSDDFYSIKCNQPKFLHYNIEGKDYYVPYFGLVPKIIDFEYTEIPEKGLLKKNDLEDKFYSRNYDILKLFVNIYIALVFYRRDHTHKVDKLLSNLEPTKSYINYLPLEYDDSLLTTLPYMINILNNSEWDEYKNYNVKKENIINSFNPV